MTEGHVRKGFVVGCLLFIFSLTPRLYQLYQTSPYTLTGDSIVHDQMARSVLEGRGYVYPENEWKKWVGTPGKNSPTAYLMPGLPLFLAAHYSLFGYHFLPPRLSLVLIASLLPVAAYFMARHCAGEQAGRLAGIIMAIWPPAISFYYSSSEVLTEPLYATLIAFAVLLLLSASEAKFRYFSASGALLGLATLLRAETILLPLVLLPWFAGRFARKRDAVTGFAIFFGSMLLLLAPWTARNIVTMHAFIPLSTHTNVLFHGNNPLARGSWNARFSFEGPETSEFLHRHPGFFSLSEVEKSRIYTREAVNFAVANPAHFLWLVGRKALLFFSPFTLQPKRDRFVYNFAVVAVLPFAALAFFRSWRDSSVWLLRLPVLHILMVSLVVFSDDRFRAPFEIFFAILACLELDRLRRRFGAVRVAGVAGIWLAGNIALYVGSRSGALYEWSRAAYRGLATWNPLQ